MGQGQTMGQLSQKVGQMSQNLNFKDKKWDKVLKNGTNLGQMGHVPKMGQMSETGQDNGTFVQKNRDICPHDVKKWDNFGTMSQKVGHGTDRTLPYNI